MSSLSKLIPRHIGLMFNPIHAIYLRLEKPVVGGLLDLFHIYGDHDWSVFLVGFVILLVSIALSALVGALLGALLDMSLRPRASTEGAK